MFELEKSLDMLRLVAEHGEKISKANIEKAGSGSSNLVKKKVLVQRGGKSFFQTFFVSSGSMADKEDRVTNERVEISTKQHHDNFDALRSHLKEMSTMDVSKVTPEHLDKLRQLTKKVRDSHDDMRFHGADPAHVEKHEVPPKPSFDSAKTTSNADTDTGKKVVSHDSFKHPNGTDINKGDKVTFDHKGVQKTGTVITTNKYQRFPNPYVKMKGDDGKVYEIVISKVASNPIARGQEQPPGKYM